MWYHAVKSLQQKVQIQVPSSLQHGTILRHKSLKFIIVILDPWTLLFLSGIEETLRSTESLDVEVSDPSSLVAWERDADFVVGIEHHVVFHQAALAVVDADDSLPHPHLVWSGAPGERVVLSPLGALAGDAGQWDTVLGVCHALLGGLADGAVAGDAGAILASLLGLSAAVCAVVGVILISVVVLLDILFVKRGWAIEVRRQHVLLECFLDVLVFRDLGEQLLVDCFAWVGLLNHAKDAVIEMLVEVLRTGEGVATSRAHAGHLAGCTEWLLGCL